MASDGSGLGGEGGGAGQARRMRKPQQHMMDKLEEELRSKLRLYKEETARNVHRRAEIELFSAVAACSAALEHLTLAAKQAAAGRAVPGEVQAAGQKALVDLGVHAERLRRLLHPHMYLDAPDARPVGRSASVASASEPRSCSSAADAPATVAPRPRAAAAAAAAAAQAGARRGGAVAAHGPGPPTPAADGLPATGKTAEAAAAAAVAALTGAPSGSGAGPGGSTGGAGVSAAASAAARAMAAAAATSVLETKTALHPVTSIEFVLRIVHETTVEWQEPEYLAVWKACVMRMLAAMHKVYSAIREPDPEDTAEVAEALYLLASVQSACFLSKPWTVSLLGVNMQTGQKAEVPPAVWDRFARAARLSEEQADILVSLNRWWKQSMAATAARRKHLAQVALGSPGDMELQEEVATQLDRTNSVYLINSIVGMVIKTTAVWTPVQAAELFVQPWPNQPVMTAALDAVERWLAALRARKPQLFKARALQPQPQAAPQPPGAPGSARAQGPPDREWRPGAGPADEAEDEEVEEEERGGQGARG